MGKKLGWVEKIWGERKKYFSNVLRSLTKIFAFSHKSLAFYRKTGKTAFPRKTFAFSCRDICVLSQNFCVLLQRYLRSLTKLLRSLAEIFAFSHKTFAFSCRDICVLSQNFCVLLQRYLRSLTKLWSSLAKIFSQNQLSSDKLFLFTLQLAVVLFVHNGAVHSILFWTWNKERNTSVLSCTVLGHYKRGMLLNVLKQWNWGPWMNEWKWWFKNTKPIAFIFWAIMLY